VRFSAVVLALVASAAIADASKWLEVQGGEWSPSVASLTKVDAALRAAVPSAAGSLNPLPNWQSYTFQYQGRTTPSGRRFVYVNAFCHDPVAHRNLNKEWVTVLDGGACFFSAKYDTESERLYDLEVNGTA
jgi:hypothetical protein